MQIEVPQGSSMDGEVVGTCSANKPVIGDGCLDKEIQRKSGAVDLLLGCRWPCLSELLVRFIHLKAIVVHRTHTHCVYVEEWLLRFSVDVAGLAFR